MIPLPGALRRRARCRRQITPRVRELTSSEASAMARRNSEHPKHKGLGHNLHAGQATTGGYAHGTTTAYVRAMNTPPPPSPLLPKPRGSSYCRPPRGDQDPLREGSPHLYQVVYDDDPLAAGVAVLDGYTPGVTVAYLTRGKHNTKSNQHESLSATTKKKGDDDWPLRSG